MNKYELILYWSHEDGAFVTEVPELAGCMADGLTRQKTFSYEGLPASQVICQNASNGPNVVLLSVRDPSLLAVLVPAIVRHVSGTSSVPCASRR